MQVSGIMRLTLQPLRFKDGASNGGQKQVQQGVGDGIKLSRPFESTADVLVSLFEAIRGTCLLVLELIDSCCTCKLFLIPAIRHIRDLVWLAARTSDHPKAIRAVLKLLATCHK